MSSPADVVKMMITAERKKVPQKREDTMKSPITYSMADGSDVVITNNRGVTWKRLLARFEIISKLPDSSTYSCSDILQQLATYCGRDRAQQALQQQQHAAAQNGVVSNEAERGTKRARNAGSVLPAALAQEIKNMAAARLFDALTVGTLSSDDAILRRSPRAPQDQPNR